jgi:hypothetical protein
MCELCTSLERKMLGQTLRDYLRPGVRISVQYALDDNDVEEIVLVDDVAGTNVTISTDSVFCWESEQRNNVVKFPG